MKNNGINIKGLCKQIKDDKKKIIWSLKDGVHSITNRNWMISFEEVPREVRLVLLSIFGGFPEEGYLLQKTPFSDEPQRSVAVEPISLNREMAKQAIRTDFLHTSSGLDNLRVFKAGEGFVYIKERFLQAIDPNFGFTNMNSFGEMAPMVFEDLNYIVLPVRIGKEKDLLTLKELTNE
ncbi:hypothetical protein [Paenibacillus polymyxa]|uniref:hypothetical protein n=1 Tax=Paenibacillus TaxID=44249 RepID=UPI0020255375|nr:hypothetical protein [Paenibacillus polymyxa]URJ42182.1 hypothetical protein MF627_001836 [Paenibacillus polymyxa]